MSCSPSLCCRPWCDAGTPHAPPTTHTGCLGPRAQLQQSGCVWTHGQTVPPGTPELSQRRGLCAGRRSQQGADADTCGQLPEGWKTEPLPSGHLARDLLRTFPYTPAPLLRQTRKQTAWREWAGRGWPARVRVRLWARAGRRVAHRFMRPYSSSGTPTTPRESPQESAVDSDVGGLSPWTLWQHEGRAHHPSTQPPATGTRRRPRRAQRGT